MERTITADAVPQAKTRTMTNFRWKIAFLIFLISFVAYMAVSYTHLTLPTT